MLLRPAASKPATPPSSFNEIFSEALAKSKKRRPPKLKPIKKPDGEPPDQLA